MKTDVQEKSHATLGASTASRWMACPGSVALSWRVPPLPESVHARLGTAAHALAELCLRKGQDPNVYVGTTLEQVEVTDDMAEYVSVFVDYCRERRVESAPGLASSTQEWVEHQFNLAHLNPPGPMFGTADFVIYDPNTYELEIVDFKYGQGVVVDVFENKQLRYYALGAMLSLKQEHRIDTVKMTIVQPRATHRDGVIRSETVDAVVLVDFAQDLLDAARRTLSPEAPLAPGAHCRWCPASGICPAQRDRAQLVAQVEFSAVPLAVPPPPALATVEELAAWLPKFHILEDWMAAVRARAQGMLERGEQVPGYKLVAKRANRSWVKEDETAAWLAAQKYTPDDIYQTKLKSPAQIEKLVGKKNLPAELTQKVSGGVSMVLDTDAREAIVAVVGSEFAVLPAGQREEET